jgi:hypothetical protein
MVRGDLRQAQQLVKFLGVSAEWRDQRGDSQRANFQRYKLSKHLAEAAAAREAGGWLKGPNGELWRFDVAGKGRDTLAATGAPVRPPTEPRMPGAPGSRPANPWLRPNPLVQQPAPSPAMELSMITTAVSKEVAVTVKELLEQHREQEVARLQTAGSTSDSTAGSTAGSSTDSRA